MDVPRLNERDVITALARIGRPSSLPGTAASRLATELNRLLASKLPGPQRDPERTLDDAPRTFYGMPLVIMEGAPADTFGIVGGLYDMSVIATVFRDHKGVVSGMAIREVRWTCPACGNKCCVQGQNGDPPTTPYRCLGCGKKVGPLDGQHQP